MSTHDDEVLARMLEAVIDGKPVDWTAARFTDPEARQRAERLRVLEAIARAHGSAQPKAESGAAPAPLPFSTWGRLRILERLSAGSAGEVFRALDPLLEREVALKLQRPAGGDTEAESRFLDEARRMARVRHPNVLFIHGADRHEGRAGFWSDLLQGRTLEETLSTQGPLGAAETAMVGVDLCRALAALHAAGLVHRDVKTTNVMREAGGRIVLLDFSTSLEGAPGAASAVGALSGSPIYMAPELLQGKPATASSDLYALGVLLFRMATGRFPCEARSLHELAEVLRRGDRLRLLDLRPELPGAFVRAVERALDPDPSRRFATAGAMEAALAAAIPGSRAPAGSRPAASRRIRPALMVAAAVATLLVGAVAAGRFLQGPAPSPPTVQATLYKHGATADEPVTNGSTIQPGDRLFLEVTGKEPLHLYVFDEDAAGHAFLLFPLPDLDLQNPLAPASPHRLPGTAAGTPRTWEVDTAGGEEHILLVASRTELPELAAASNAFPLPDDGSGNATRRFRGVGRLASEPRPEPVTGSEESRLTALLDRLRSGDRRDIWTHVIDLQNPAP